MTELFSIITEFYEGLATYDLAGAGVGVGLVFAYYTWILGLFKNPSQADADSQAKADYSFTQSPIMGGISLGLPLVVARVCRVLIIMLLLIANLTILGLVLGNGYVITIIGAGSVKITLSYPLKSLMLIVSIFIYINVIAYSYELATITYRLLSFFLLPFFPYFTINYVLYFDTQATEMLTTILNLRKISNSKNSNIQYEYEYIDYCMLICAAIGSGLLSVIKLTIAFAFFRLYESYSYFL